MNDFEFDEIENFRDVAEFDCRYGKPTKGVIYRSATIAFSSEKDLQKLHDLGIRSVFDLRGESRRTEAPSPLKGDPDIVVYDIDIPSGAAYPDSAEEVPDLYLKYAEDPRVTRTFFRTLIRAPKPALIHCEAGKDRTGVFCLLLQMANGVSRENLCASYNASYDGRLSKTAKRSFARLPWLKDFSFSMPENMIGDFIDKFLERYGNLEDYFEAMGLGEDEISAISNLLGLQETSAGAVVVYNGRVLVEHMEKGHYSMPKGHVEEQDADLYATAAREILEETGLEVDFDRGFSERSVYSPAKGIIKEVHWFLAFARSNKTKPQVGEVSDCYFLTPSDALRVLSHDDDRRILSQACAYLNKKED